MMNSMAIKWCMGMWALMVFGSFRAQAFEYEDGKSPACHRSRSEGAGRVNENGDESG